MYQIFLKMYLGFQSLFRVENNLQSLPKGPHKILRTMGRYIGVLVAQGLDVPNFLKDVPRVLKSVSR